MGATQKLWLHVGPAKTGTTSIQTTFFESQAALATQGLCYPGVPDNGYSTARYAHHFLARAAAQGDMSFVDTYLAGLPQMSDTVISSEGFYRSFAAHGDAFAGLLKRYFKTTVVFYVREPVARVNSLAQQFLKTGRATLAELNENPPRVPVRKELLRLADLFGHDRLTVRLFDTNRFEGGDLIADFCSAIARPDLADQLRRVRLNDSISMETAANIDQHRRDTGDTSIIKPQDTRFVSGSTRFTLSDGALDIVRQRTAKDLAWLQQTYGITF